MRNVSLREWSSRIRFFPLSVVRLGYVLIDALHLDHADMEVFNAKLQVSFAPSNYLFIRTLSLEPAWAVERVKLFYQEPRISPVGFALLLSMFSADGAQTLESPAFIISICVCS